MVPNNRKCIIQTAQGWFNESRKAQKAGNMAEALLYMENAFNHTENALGGLLRAARAFPRETPGPGGAATEHAFQLSAATVWDLDRTLKLIDGDNPVPNGGSGRCGVKKWFCTDCDDTFNDETGERCPQCGFRRIVGPVQYATAAECREAIWRDDGPNGDRGSAA